MKKKIIALALALCLIVGMLPLSAAAEDAPTPWDGTADTTWYNDADETFTITTAEQLAGLAQLVNGGNRFTGKTITLGADLDLGGIDGGGNGVAEKMWTPIGTQYYDNDLEYYAAKKFAGVFDGNKKTISGLYINREERYQGLFGYSYNGTIKDLTVSGSVTGKYNVGGICGDTEGSNNKILNCTVNAAIAGDERVGGVCGNNGGTISGCSFEGTVTGRRNDTGGICGKSSSAISGCSVEGTVTGNGNMGGVCGNNTGSVTLCSFTGNVIDAKTESAGTPVGGICGVNWSEGSVTACWAAGTVVSHSSSVGGVCGSNNSSVNSCWFRGEASMDNGDGTYYRMGITSNASPGTVTNSCFLNTPTSGGENVNNMKGTSVTAEQFDSGEVCWLLNGGDSQLETPYWHQTLGDDGEPSFTGATAVYKIKNCAGNDIYSNTNEDETHDIAYSASGAVLTASCTKCSATLASLTLTAPASLTYTGSAIVPTITGTTAWEALGLTVPTIKYTYGSETDTATAPINAGSVAAKITAGTDSGAKTASLTYTIEKATHATYGTTQSAEASVIKSNAGTKTCTLPCSDIPGVSYAVTAKTTANIVADTAPTIDGTTLTYTTKTCADANKTDTITVTISSTNYQDITFVLTVRSINKADAGVTLSGAPTSAKTYGDDDFTLTATAANEGDNGTWTWTSSDESVLTVADGVVTIVGAGSATITATYESDATLGSASAEITVNKAAQTILGLDNVYVSFGDTCDLDDDFETDNNTSTLTYALAENETVPANTTFDPSTGVVDATSATAEGTFDVVVTAPETATHAAETTTTTVHIVDKAAATVTLTGVPASKTYGDSAFTVIAAATDCGSADGNWQITVSDSTVFSLGSATIDGSSCSVSVTPLKASTSGAAITAVFESATHKGSATSASITVGKATVTVAAGAYKVSKTYDGGTTAGTGSGDLSVSGVLSGDTGVTVTPTIPAFSSANAGTGNLTVTLALSGAGNENYQLASSSLSVPYEIIKKPITPTVEDIAAVDYTGSALTPAVTVKDSGTALASTDFEVTYSNNTNAGTATATVKAKTTGNYSFSDTTKDFTINKIAYTGSAITASKSVLVSKAQTGVEVDLTSAISGITGAAVASAAEGTDTENLISNVSTNGNKVIFDVASVATTGTSATINVTISSTNYSNFAATLTVTTVSKSEATVTLGTVPTSKTYGDSTFTLTATAANTGANGAWTWTSSNTGVLTVTDAGVVTIVGAGSATVTATYESDATLGSATSASITVGKATVTVAAKNQSIYVNGTVPDLTNPVKDTHYTVTGLVGSDELTGTLALAYEKDNAAVALADVDATQPGAYDIVVSGVTEPNSTNYNAIVLTGGTLTISNRPAPPPPSTGDDEEDEKPETCDGGDSCPGHVFSDVDHTQWYHTAVDYVIEHKLMTGIGNGKFDPKGTLTRAMLCQILYNKEGKPAVTGENTFTDLKDGAWYENAVTWAAENNIVSGYGGSKFGPNDPITREQLAAILWRYDGKPTTGGSLSAFTDGGKTSDFATTPMQWAVEKKIVTGKGNDVLDPIGKAQRCEVAAMVMRYLEMDQ